MTREATFDIPAGSAVNALKLFSAQSGQQLLYSNADLAGVTTNEVKGRLNITKALDQMLADTPLVASRDASNSAVAVARTERRTESPVPTTAEATAASASESRNAPPQDDDAIVLSPFTVTGEEDDGYLATSTLAGTRIRTNRRDIGSALSIITPQFLKDIGARNSRELLVYTLGTEIGGVGGNFTGAGNGVVLTERGMLAEPDKNNRIRGLATADNTRDLNTTDIPWDTYNIDRVEMQRGPNAILFGLGSPGGLINSSLKQAGFKNLGSVATRFDSNNSIRASLDLNRVLLKKELAIRLDTLKDRTYYQQKPAFNDDERIFGALRYDPRFLNKGSAHTSLRVNYEHGKIKSNNPRSMPPMDRITPWFETGTTTVNGRVFNNLNKYTDDFRYRNLFFPSIPGSGSLLPSSTFYQPGISDLNNGNYAFLDPGVSGVQIGKYYANQTAYNEAIGGLGPNGSVDGTIGGLFGTARLSMVGTTSEIARRLGVPFAFDIKNKAIVDTSIYDYFHLLIDGPTKRERRNFEAVNIALSQTFWNNRVGLEVAFDHQRYEMSNDAFLWGVGTGDAAITVDVNSLLPDGTPNPNVGRPMVANRSVQGGNGTQTERKDLHVTAFAELRADDFLKQSWLATFLGRHVFTAAVSQNDYFRADQSRGNYAINTGSSLFSGQLFIRREFNTITYLGPDLRGRNSASGLNLSNIQRELFLTNNTAVAFDATWKPSRNPADASYVNPAAVWVNPLRNNLVSTQSENPANYVGWTNVPVQVLSTDLGDKRLLTTFANKGRDKVSSQAFVWQGYFWKDKIVTTFGYRKDIDKAYKIAATNAPDGFADESAARYVLPTTPSNRVNVSSKSYSVVVHTPDFIRNRLPKGMDFSLFYNTSSNFQPAASRVDVLAKPMDSPEGVTTDYGIVVSFLDSRFLVRVNKFDSTANNASYTLLNANVIGDIERASWISAKRYEAGLTGNPLYAGPEYNYGAVVNGVFTQTQADRARQQQDVKAVLDNFAPEIWTAWNLGGQPTDAFWQLGAGASFALPPAGMTGTTDTFSKGYEIELNFKPVNDWDIALNAANIKAGRTNIAGGTMKKWMDARNAVWNGPGGNMLMSGTGTATYSERWNSGVYNNYKLQQLLDGSLAPEVRQWRVNFITNYRFSEGKLKNFNLGGAYRWEDKVVIGYPSITTTINGVSLNSYDIKKPYYGPGDEGLDLWIGYTRKISRNIKWHAQLNTRNLLGKNELIPINAQPDGSAAAFRIKEGVSWQITNTFEF